MSTQPASSTASLIDAIMEVMQAAFDPQFREAWNRRQISNALVLPSTHALIVNSQGESFEEGTAQTPAGFLLSRHAADEEELLLIAVLPELRGRGLGQILIDQLFAAAKARGVATIFLEMRRGNPAVHLYQKVGFEPIGERRNYYKTSDGKLIDAITFAKPI